MLMQCTHNDTSVATIVYKYKYIKNKNYVWFLFGWVGSMCVACACRKYKKRMECRNFWHDDNAWVCTWRTTHTNIRNTFLNYNISFFMVSFGWWLAAPSHQLNGTTRIIWKNSANTLVLVPCSCFHRTFWQSFWAFFFFFGWTLKMPNMYLLFSPNRIHWNMLRRTDQPNEYMCVIYVHMRRASKTLRIKLNDNKIIWMVVNWWAGRWKGRLGN